MTRRALLGLLIALSACGAKPPGRGAAASSAEAAADQPLTWTEMLIDPRRDVVLRLAPRELTRDPVFGRLVERGLEAALEHARGRGASSSTLEIVARSEDLVVAVRDREGTDAVAIVSGVPQGRSPVDLVDESGKALFVPAAPLGGGKVRVYAGAAIEQRARVFELAGNTWVVGIGAGAQRAEIALSRADSLAYAPPLHPIADVTFAGELLNALKARTGTGLRPVARGLDSATLTLARDPSSATRARVRLELIYRDERSAEGAEPTASRAAELLTSRLDFPVRPKVTRSGRVVAVEIAIEAPATSANEQ